MSRKLRNIELNRLSSEEFRQAEKIPLVLVLDNVRSMSNVGSIFRSCDAFRVRKIYLCGITGTPPHKEIRKTALGAEESMEWEYAASVTGCAEKLKAEGYTLYALEQTENSQKLGEMTVCWPAALVLGNEVDGVSQELIDQCDAVIEIPQYGTKHSLNVAVSAGIALYQLSARADIPR
jgi:23S rRNA (guanosine2251-2'-O)-methyltransferase